MSGFSPNNLSVPNTLALIFSSNLYYCFVYQLVMYSNV